MWKYVVGPDGPQMRFACWITKATDIHSEYVICFAFLREQLFREHASVLRL